MGSALGVLGFLIAVVLVCYFTTWLLRAVGITAPFYLDIIHPSGFNVSDERNIEIYENLPKDSFWAKTYRREMEEWRRQNDALIKHKVKRFASDEQALHQYEAVNRTDSAMTERAAEATHRALKQDAKELITDIQALDRYDALKQYANGPSDEPKEMSEKDNKKEAYRKWKEGKP